MLMSDNIRTVFLVGNGVSRRGFLLSSIRHKGILIGCNLAYRDYPDFDAIVSIDYKASKFVEKEFNGLHLFNDCFKTDNIYCKSLSYKLDKLPKLEDKLDSGKLAAYLAKSFFKADRLIMLGMDFGGEDLYMECKFENRPNFEKDWNILLSSFKEVIRVGEPKEECKKLNLKQIPYSELEDIL